MVRYPFEMREQNPHQPAKLGKEKCQMQIREESSEYKLFYNFILWHVAHIESKRDKCRCEVMALTFKYLLFVRGRNNRLGVWRRSPCSTIQYVQGIGAFL